MPDVPGNSPDACQSQRSWSYWQLKDYVAFCRRLGPAGLLTFLAAAIPSISILFVAGLAVHLAPWLRGHLVMGLVIYIVSFWVLGSLAVVPTWVHSGLAGLAFGFPLGLFAAIVSYIGGSLAGYYIAYRFSGRHVTDLIAEHPKWQAVYTALLRSGFWRALLIMGLVRSTPTSPYAITNVLSAAMRVPALPYILGTILGLTPRTAAVVYTAHRYQTLDTHSAHDTALFLGSVVITLLAILVIVVISKRALAHMTQPAAEGAVSTESKP